MNDRERPVMAALFRWNFVRAEVRQTGDLERLIARYKAFRSNPNHKYIDTTTIMNRVGHYLLNAGRADDALRVFLINAGDSPTSGIVYQSLGDVYATKGDKQKALENYKKAVSLDPKLTASAGAIKVLSEK